MRRVTLSIAIVYLTILIYISSGFASAQILWTADGMPVCVSSASNESPSIVSDGVGGVIITWANQNSGASWNIFAQRLDANGNRLWAADGVPICSEVFDQYFPAICSDGAGGAIIAWQDARAVNGESDIYAQRVDATGTVRWTTNGVPVCLAPGDQYGVAITSDGQGGAYIAWRDTRNDQDGASTDIYLQHIDSDGQVLWPSDLPIATSAFQDDRDISILSDGKGGAILVWQDGRGVTATPATGKDIYAQRVNASGNYLWNPNGVAVCTASGDQRYPDAAVDERGNLLICWDDKRSGTDYDIYVQRINPNGCPTWMQNGVPVCLIGGSNQMVPTIAPDETGGAYVAWTDARDGTSTTAYNIYAQRVTDLGSIAWTTNGVAICNAAGWQGRIKSVSDGLGNALFAWLDNRTDPTSATYNYDIYVQKVNSAGITQWAVNGVVACGAGGRQDFHEICLSGVGNAVLVWADTRTDLLRDLYAQRIGVSGPTYSPVARISEAKHKENAEWISVNEKVVTGVLGNSFYIEEPDRSSGIRVNATGVSEGQSVRIIGEITTQNGERVLSNATVLIQGTSAVPAPLYITNKALGGSAFGQNTPGVTNGNGLNNIGLLVTASGRVTNVGRGFVYIDDGSALNDGSGNQGIKVDTSFLSITPSGQVIITGISSAEESSPGKINAILRPRRNEDVFPR